MPIGKVWRVDAALLVEQHCRFKRTKQLSLFGTPLREVADTQNHFFTTRIGFFTELLLDSCTMH